MQLDWQPQRIVEWENEGRFFIILADQEALFVSWLAQVSNRVPNSANIGQRTILRPSLTEMSGFLCPIWQVDNEKLEEQI